VIVDAPDATHATLTCAWCEQPLDSGLLRPFGTLRCPTCGSTTAAGWPTGEATRAASGPRPERHGTRICSLAEAARRRARRQLAARIARIAPPGPVLDVGSGDGMLLDALRATGRLTTGIDQAPRRAGVREAEITELGGRYAAIVFWQSLGRLRAPATALEHAAALLKPGGLLAIAQPSAGRQHAHALRGRWLAREAADPRVAIPERSLLDRLHDLGLQIERIERPLERGARGGWLQAALSGVVSIEARR
jgi:SAM-dependent methyltransferase